MNILWFSWKDTKHPQAGGAELVTHQLLSRLAGDGHQVTLLTSRPEGLSATESLSGYKIIRVGNRYTVYLNAWRYYKKHLADWPDTVIEEINTLPFFTRFYVNKPSLLFIHQLARQVWHYQMPVPLSWIGYLAEPLYLRMLNKQKVITISESTKHDLVATAAFRPSSIQVIREGIELAPLSSLSAASKYRQPTLLSLGSVRPMKRTADIVRAFEIAKTKLPALKLIIAGNNTGSYGQSVLQLILESPYQKDITVLGNVTLEKKQELMQKAHLLMLTSIKEGWGLTATEANSQGTPVVAYDVDGLRDSTKAGQTGLVTAPNPTALAQGVIQLLSDDELYAKCRSNAWKDSKQYTFNNLYSDFLSHTGLTKNCL